MSEDQAPPARVVEPGFFYDLPVDDYFADPCPTPSLTQSIAKILNAQSPLHAWFAHPRLNPNFERDEATKFDVGNVAHRLMLGRGKEIVVLDPTFGDWKTKAAREARALAEGAGKIGVLTKTFDRATLMVHAARAQLADRGLAHFFRDGAAEVVMAWREDGFWCRQMVDWIIGAEIVLDYKTTEMSVAPHGLGRMMATAGWDVQAAMAERGLHALSGPSDPKFPLTRRFIFVVQEAKEPFCISVAELPEDTMVMGRKKLAHAMGIWNDCIKNDHWPAYPLEIVKPLYPGWAESQWLEREVHEAAAERRPAPPADLIMAG